MSLICGIQKIIQMNYECMYVWIQYIQDRNRFTVIENKLGVTKGDKEGGREKLEVWN